MEERKGEIEGIKGGKVESMKGEQEDYIYVGGEGGRRGKGN